jgi:hypothetical protein
MKCLYTVHAGEYLVGTQVEKEIDGASVWLPSKDQGIDLLITNPKNGRMVALQVKLSRDYHNDYNLKFQKDLKAFG